VALNPGGLQSSLASFFGNLPVAMVGGAADRNATASACAQQWANAMQSYAAAIVPASTTVTGAASALSSSLASAFLLADASSAVDAAFETFAASVGSGMASFTATPPPAPPGFASAMGTLYSDNAAAAAAWASRIDTWMRTGTATPLPSGSPVPWS
jgi:hypothetical protein